MVADTAWQAATATGNFIGNVADATWSGISSAASYCFGRGARTCATAAAMIGLAATGVGIFAGLGVFGATAAGYAGTLGTIAGTMSVASSLFSFISYKHTRSGSDLRNGILGLALPAAWKGVRYLRGVRAMKSAPARVFASRDPLVANAANAIESAMPGRIVGVNTMVKMGNGLRREVDIDLGNIVVQVKSGSARRLTAQLAKTVGTTGRRVVGYAPNMPGQAWEALAMKGIPVARTLDELLAIVKELG